MNIHATPIAKHNDRGPVAESDDASPETARSNWAWPATAWASAALAACGGGADSPSPQTAASVTQGLNFQSAPQSGALALPPRVLHDVTKQQVTQTQTSLTPDVFMSFVEGALSTSFPGPQTSVSASTNGINYVYR
ncbi:MAG: hypothetical protein WCH60_08815, partial [Burkholderiales bacterium]